MIGLLLGVVAVVVFFRWRAVRKRNLAGLNSVKPVFSVEPPTRRVGSRKVERL